MWNLYCRDGMGVAVCTTAERFLDILERHSGDGNWRGKWRLHFTLARVVYADHGRFKAPLDLPLALIKRKAFAHEREVRALTSLPFGKLAKRVMGIELKVNTRYLITRVITHPESPGWFINAARDVTSQYGLARNVIVPSGLREPTSSNRIACRSFHRSHKPVYMPGLVEVPWRKPPWERRRR